MAGAGRTHPAPLFFFRSIRPRAARAGAARPLPLHPPSRLRGRVSGAVRVAPGVRRPDCCAAYPGDRSDRRAAARARRGSDSARALRRGLRGVPPRDRRAHSQHLVRATRLPDYLTVGAEVGEFVGAIIERVVAVAADPFELDAAARRLRVQPLPQVEIRLALPSLGHRVHDVLAVAPEHDSRSRIGVAQRLNRGRDFHAIVGGRGIVAVDFAPLALAFLDDHRAPSAAAGIADTGAVGIDEVVLSGAGHFPGLIRGSG